MSDRVLRDGDEHAGIELAFGGASAPDRLPGPRRRVDVAVSADRRLHRPRRRPRPRRRRRPVRRGRHRGRRADDRAAVVRFTDADGSDHEIRAASTWWAPTGRAACAARQFPRRQRRQFFREYPFAWFGILCEAPPSAPELIYNHSDRGFALISQRTPTLQRMYFQCDPEEDVGRLVRRPDLERAAGPGRRERRRSCRRGRSPRARVLPFRSFVQEPMRYGNLVLAGDAAHTVPPTGAKGLNLALADVRVLAESLERLLRAQATRRRSTTTPQRALAAGVEGAALLLLDDHDAAPAARRQRLRRTPPDRRADLAGRVPGGRHATSPRATPAGRSTTDGPGGARLPLSGM